LRCLACHRFSLSILCSDCRQRLLPMEITRRAVGELEVISLFSYTTIAPLIVHKHTPTGYRIFRLLGREYFAPFFSAFADQLDEPVTVIGMDEHVRYGYAHTALLTQAVRHRFLRIEHGTLRARNRVIYAGKSLQYRQNHPRDFVYTGHYRGKGIVVDDVVTTGLTLAEASSRLEASGIEVLFAVTLADARKI